MLIAIDGYVSVQRSVRLFDQEMEDHALLLGHALAPLVTDAWLEGGDDRARALLGEVSRDEDALSLRLLSAEAAADVIRPFDGAVSTVLEGGKDFSTIREGPADPGSRYTLVPVMADGSVLAVIELTESLASLDAHRRESALRTLGLVLLSALMGAVAIRFLGLRMVGRPLHVLSEKARRVGQGDLDGEVQLSGSHEFQELATALNTMCVDLVRARAQANEEQAAKLQAIEQARHHDRLHTIGELAAGVAHELGTPLNVIAGRADMIVDEDRSNGEITRFAKVIRAQAERMDGIVRELLRFGRRSPAGKTPTMVGDLVRDTLEVLAPLARKSRIEVVLSPCDDFMVEVDAPQVQQVVTNLVLNALQASQPGGRVEVRVERGSPKSVVQGGPIQEHVMVVVQDFGAGMAKDEVDRIFDPFYTTKGVGEGTGLGLSIAHGIVEDHGGWINVKSDLGVGSRFEVCLPTGADG